MSRAFTKIDRSPFTPIARSIAAWIIPRLPAWITPNQITCIGCMLYVTAGLSFVLASVARHWFLVASLCIFLHWITDNLDGELARARQLSSQRGFFLDLFLDTVGGAAVGAGLGLASYTLPHVLLIANMVILLASVLTVFRLFLTSEFQIPTFGPAEIRMILVMLALASFVWNNTVVTVGGVPLGWFDLAGCILILIVGCETTIRAVQLYRRLEPPIH